MQSLLRQIKYNTKPFRVKREMGLIQEHLMRVEKIRVGFCAAICNFKAACKCFGCCCGECGRRKVMASKFFEKGINRIEHFLDVDKLINSRINTELLQKRFLNK